LAAVIIFKLMDLLVLLIFGLIMSALIIWLIFLTVEQKRINRRVGVFFTDDPKSLGDQLRGYAKNVKTVEDHCFGLDKKIASLGAIAESGLYKKGFVRYNPFGDVGGNQSFSLALIDGTGNGYVISSIHSREGTRVYAKTVEAGGSEYNLSEEEKKAIKIAIK
jgi:hypothetical protein